MKKTFGNHVSVLKDADVFYIIYYLYKLYYYIYIKYNYINYIVLELICTIIYDETVKTPI